MLKFRRDSASSQHWSLLLEMDMLPAVLNMYEFEDSPWEA